MTGPTRRAPQGSGSLRLVASARPDDADTAAGDRAAAAARGDADRPGAGLDGAGRTVAADRGSLDGDGGSDGAPLTRQERKLRTRNALLAAALEQLESRSFGAISLREVSRAAGITPTAFYRHFESMEELGLVLVDESFASLREMMRVGRAEAQAPGDDIRASAATLVRHVGTHHPHYRFIARERSGGVASLRAAIAREIQSYSNDLVADLRRYPVLEDLDQAGIELVAGLIVTVMVATAERLLDAPPDAEDAIRRNTEDQMRLIVLGALRWNHD